LLRSPWLHVASLLSPVLAALLSQGRVTVNHLSIIDYFKRDCHIEVGGVERLPNPRRGHIWAQTHAVGIFRLRLTPTSPSCVLFTGGGQAVLDHGHGGAVRRVVHRQGQRPLRPSGCNSARNLAVVGQVCAGPPPPPQTRLENTHPLFTCV
jgi:hypothetical protein